MADTVPTSVTSDPLAATLLQQARKARAASRALAQASPEARTAALHGVADALAAASAEVLAANARDVATAGARGMSPAMLDRLTLTPARMAALVGAVREVAEQPDPVGVKLATWTRPNGLEISRVSQPLGLIAVIYESRPNVTADAAALCLRAGNACLLRGGSESLESSQVLIAAIRAGLAAAGADPEAVQGVATPDRAAVGHILTGLDGQIDVVIPRGGRSLVARVQADARVPVIGHLEGLCHTYVHAAADPKTAVEVTFNAKMRRTGVCGATETLLIDAACAPSLLPAIAARLTAAGCELRGDAAARALVPMAEATEDDWRTEYLAPILAVRVVAGLPEALAHIATYGTGHTDAILTEDLEAAEAFLNGVDSAIALHNASTQFADGGEFGFGGEIGIATGRIHARGPVGAAQLTTFCYQVRGTGQIRP
jgi:glutamate-5-semialdehyde dehydrogenase